MKKQIIILFLLLGSYLQSYDQIRSISVNCDDSVLMSIKGVWKKKPDNITPPSHFSGAQIQEALNRMNTWHQLLQEAYPNPTGNDGSWWRNLSQNIYAANKRTSHFIPLCAYSYYCAFGYYSCLAYHPKQVAPGGETSTWFRVYANQMGELMKNMLNDTMSVNGLPVFCLNPIKAKWKGYNLVYCGESSRAVLITRKGASPYIPVTRKQYLDFCFRWIDQTFAESVKSLDLLPLRSLAEQEEEKKKALDKIDLEYKNDPSRKEIVRNMYLGNYETDQQIRDKNIAIQLKLKVDILNRYQKELDKTISSNLLDSAAIVLQMHPVTEEASIFVGGNEDGMMLVTDNPSYIQKDLPAYVPQFIVLYWAWNEGTPQGYGGGSQGRYFRKMVEANFPIDKLQAMIDK